MTISEFLLARIAEDEERARHVQAQQADDPQPISEGYQWWEEYDLLYVPPARVLAECQAKRAIIEQCASGLANGYFGEATLAEVTQRTLATVYADHPDYDEAWRP